MLPPHQAHLTLVRAPAVFNEAQVGILLDFLDTCVDVSYRNQTYEVSGRIASNNLTLIWARSIAPMCNEFIEFRWIAPMLLRANVVSENVPMPSNEPYLARVRLTYTHRIRSRRSMEMDILPVECMTENGIEITTFIIVATYPQELTLDQFLIQEHG